MNEPLKVSILAVELFDLLKLMNQILHPVIIYDEDNLIMAQKVIRRNSEFAQRAVTMLSKKLDGVINETT